MVLSNPVAALTMDVTAGPSKVSSPSLAGSQPPPGSESRAANRAAAELLLAFRSNNESMLCCPANDAL